MRASGVPFQDVRDARSTASAFGLNLGRHVFGAAVFAFGLIALIWPDYYDWLALSYVNAQTGRLFCDAASVAQIAGGVALQFPRTAKLGAAAIGVVYLLIALLSVPQIVATPKDYAPWGDFFLEISLAVGAVIVYARLSPGIEPKTLDRIARMLLGVCAVSDALYQALYPNPTAALVPKWIPPSPMFWTVVTTIFFALAAVAILTNRMTLLATRLLTLMLVLFGLIVWIPAVLSQPHVHTNWTETADNFAIAGATWIVLDLFTANRLGTGRLRS